jgi:2-amino-4-hydroxy-6-hydroxymethyldihydropteridine diphosphokinase
VKKQDLLENQVKISYLAIGSNLGNKILNIVKAKFELHKDDIKIIKSSSNFLSESWPNPSNPRFINAVIKIQTNLSPLSLLKKCNSIEDKLGRKRFKKNAPRLCDIDIIDYDQKILNLDQNKLILPHPRINQRNFVLLPLFEIDKTWKHPKSKMNIVNLINSLSTKNLRSIKQI